MGKTLSFSWDWGDGTSPSLTSQATHSYATPGRYVVKLTVTDPGGLTDHLAFLVDVEHEIIERIISIGTNGEQGDLSLYDVIDLETGIPGLLKEDGTFAVERDDNTKNTELIFQTTAKWEQLIIDNKFGNPLL